MTQPNPPHQLPTWQPAQIPHTASTGTGPQVAGTTQQSTGQITQQPYSQWGQGQQMPSAGHGTQAPGSGQPAADTASSQAWPSNPAPADTLPPQEVPRKKRWWRSKVAIGVAGVAVMAGSYGLGFATHALVYGGSSSNGFTQNGSFPGAPNGGPGGGFGDQQGNGGSGRSDEGGTGGSDGSNSSDSGTGTSSPVPSTTATDSTDA